jgi:dihydroneopterin aldolase
VYAEEHIQTQRFSLDIEIKQEIRDWGENLENTYDYMIAREIARCAVEEKSFKLIETLGEEIAKEILKHPLVGEVLITIKKLDVIAPAEVGVVLRRAK